MEYNKTKKLSLVLNIIFYILSGLIIILGIYTRTKAFMTNLPFTHDEASLGYLFFNLKFPDFFKSIDDYLKIPPLWGICNKIILNSFGYSFITFRFIAYFSSIISCFAFFVLLKNIFKNKLSILVGLILFTLSIPLIFFSANFRPYESDVLICILLLLSYKYISLKQITLPLSILYSVISILLVLFSFPSLIIIPAIIFAKSIEDKKFNYKSLIIIVTVALCCLYLYLIDKSTYLFMEKYWGSIEDGFIDFKSLYYIFKDFFEYVFSGFNPLWLITTVCILGFINFDIQKREEKNVLLFILIFALGASLLHIYPFSRKLILYFIPVIIIYSVSLIDNSWEFLKNNLFKNLISILISCLILFSMNIKIDNIKSFTPNNYKYDISRFKNRIELHYHINELLNEYNENDLLLCPNEVYFFLLFYNKLYGYNKNLQITTFPFEHTDTEKVENFVADYVRNKPKSKKLYIINKFWAYQAIPNIYFIEKLLTEQNLKYERIIDECIYIFKIYD